MYLGQIILYLFYQNKSQRSYSMLEAYKRFFSNYVNFEGRANRAEYWWVVLWNVIITLFCLFLGAMAASSSDDFWRLYGVFLIGIYGIYSLATIIPSISLIVRRLHDIDKTGWLCLIGLIPYIGGLIVLVLTLLEGTKGPNRYGEPSDF